MENNRQIVTTQEIPLETTANEIVTQGSDRAKQLMTIVNQNQWAKDIQGKNYLQVEAWQTLGRFYGYTAKTKSTEFVEIGTLKGFNAIVEILDKDGKVVGGAEAGCYTDEKKWANSPLYSLKSMAQTRATGKAFRQILSWVAVLAGYEATPAEEMDGVIAYPASESVPQVKQPINSTNADWKTDPASQAQKDKIVSQLTLYFGSKNRDKQEAYLQQMGVVIASLTKGEAHVVITDLERKITVAANNRKVTHGQGYKTAQTERDFNELILDEETN